MVYRKTDATEARKEARRRQLLDAATRLFGKHGYHATTVPMIVAEAQSSTGSFYLYFRNKEDVFHAVLEELGVAIVELMDEIDRSHQDVLRRLHAGLECIFIHFAQKPDHAHILIVESSGVSPRIDQARRAILMQQEQKVQQMLESAPEVFITENSLIVARCMVGAGYEALSCWLQETPETRMPAAEVARVVSQFTTHAVKRTPMNLN